MEEIYFSNKMLFIVLPQEPVWAGLPGALWAVPSMHSPSHSHLSLGGTFWGTGPRLAQEDGAHRGRAADSGAFRRKKPETL